MTNKEFTETHFHKGMTAIVDGEEMEIIGIDFELSLLGFSDGSTVLLNWIEIEKCELSLTTALNQT